LYLSVEHSRASHGLVSDMRLRHAARRALRAARRRGTFSLSLAFVSDSMMRRLNRQYAGNDYVTDVLSFPARESIGTFRSPRAAQLFLGEIIIALPQARRQARAAGHSPADEVEMLFVHGVLHLLGHDHGTTAEAARMRALERRAIISD
ncbi:MAG: rRNA maturation RNase YbeY, partial [Chloroflexi bacterium]|nr:rRNA maturation RNase YbeY [Chloroflexota bacterium]